MIMRRSESRSSVHGIGSGSSYNQLLLMNNNNNNNTNGTEINNTVIDNNTPIHPITLKPLIMPGKPLPKGRKELLTWLNNLLQTNYKSIEECSDGIAYMQIFDVLFPKQHLPQQGLVPMHKLNFNAVFPQDKKQNLLLLSKVFRQLKINYPIPADKLANAKLQDNIEFLQWCYTFFVKNYTMLDGEEYDPYKRREDVVNSQIEAANQRKRQQSYSSTSRNIVVNVGIKSEEIKQRLFPNKGNLFPLQFDNEGEEEENVNKRNRGRSVLKEIQIDDLPKDTEIIKHFSNKLENEIYDILLNNEREYEEINKLIDERDEYIEKLMEIELLCKDCSEDASEETLEIILEIVEILRTLA